MGMDLHSARNFMIAALRSHMKTIDYVYLIPWLAHVSFRHNFRFSLLSSFSYPWLFSSISPIIPLSFSFFLRLRFHVFQIHDHYPWEASNIEKLETKSAFDDAVVITAHGYDKKFIEEFEQRFSKVTGIISSYVRVENLGKEK